MPQGLVETLKRVYKSREHEGFLRLCTPTQMSPSALWEPRCAPRGEGRQPRLCLQVQDGAGPSGAFSWTLWGGGIWCELQFPYRQATPLSHPKPL